MRNVIDVQIDTYQRCERCKRITAYNLICIAVYDQWTFFGQRNKWVRHKVIKQFSSPACTFLSQWVNKTSYDRTSVSLRWVTVTRCTAHWRWWLRWRRPNQLGGHSCVWWSYHIFVFRWQIVCSYIKYMEILKFLIRFLTPSWAYLWALAVGEYIPVAVASMSH